jgi:hypothetical protein
MSDKQDDRPKPDRFQRPPIPEYDRFQMRNDFAPYGSPTRETTSASVKPDQ